MVLTPFTTVTAVAEWLIPTFDQGICVTAALHSLDHRFFNARHKSRCKRVAPVVNTRGFWFACKL